MGVIVYSTVPLTVGSNYTHEIINHDGETFSVPFVVLREASREEWLQNTEDGELKEEWLKRKGVVVDSYYEVSMD